MFKRIVNYFRGIFNKIEGATLWSPARSYIQQGYQSSRFDASKSDRITLVRKARYFEYNSPIINRLADIFENYTVGSGTPVIPNSSDPEWNKRASAVWERFCKYPMINSRMSFATMQSLVARRWFVDGEVFILLTSEPVYDKSGRVIGAHPRLQLIETHLINTPPASAQSEGDRIIDGVTVDQTMGGRPVGYYIGQEDGKGQVSYTVATAAKNVIHVCEPMRANEYRCLPFITPCVNILHDLDDLHLYEMKAAKAAADIALIISTSTGELDPKSMRAARFTQSGINKDGAAPEDKTTYYKDATGGRSVVLKTGDKVDQLANGRPSVVTQAYWRSLTEYICAATGIPYQLAFPESIQGTVYRGVLAMSATYFESRFLTLRDVWQRIYEYVIEAEMKGGNPELRGAPADWYACTIQAPQSPDVDKFYNSSATIAELEAGTLNFGMVFGPRGKDWQVELRNKAIQVKFIKDLAAEYGLDPAEISAFKLTATQPPQPQQDGGQSNV